MNLSKKDIVVSNFLGGLAWGFGTVVGATLVVAFIYSSLNALGVFEPFKPLFENTPIGKSLPQTN